MIKVSNNSDLIFNINMETIFKADDRGFFGDFGGKFIPEILHEVFEKLIKHFEECKADLDFWNEYVTLGQEFSSRPTSLTRLDNLSRLYGSATVYAKREDLNHTGAHKFNNVLGQGLLAKKIGKKRIIAETGAGQHGVATATIAARLGLECVIYMGAVDVERQYPNVFWMKQLGAKVVPVTSGSGTLKDAINEALRDWSTNPDTTHYLLGTACGAHPFPEMVAHFQKIIGLEAKEQILKKENTLPSKVYACVGGGSNAIGIFSGFIENKEVELIGVEAGGLGKNSGHHAARFHTPESAVGIAQGYKTYFLQNKDGQMMDTHSISAGLDYIGVSPILADLYDKGRVRFESATDNEVINATKVMIKNEGIIPALESAHAIAQAIKELPKLSNKEVIIINISGRGDKDIFTIGDAFGEKEWRDFIKKKHDFYDENN